MDADLKKTAGNGKVNYNQKKELVFEGFVKNLKFLGEDGSFLTPGNSGKIPPGPTDEGGSPTPLKIQKIGGKLSRAVEMTMETATAEEMVVVLPKKLHITSTRIIWVLLPSSLMRAERFTNT
ncbi:hypothetical protein [Persicobacter diffluens]|uniref:Uncharacterized protein n=1 Tax=Persicobacter diffluens TaxID=981 RepID=A0AAN5AQM8_9BACT|nr:hypothetical protein PEDI_55750 [Persicobacter diffluens]